MKKIIQYASIAVFSMFILFSAFKPKGKTPLFGTHWELIEEDGQIIGLNHAPKKDIYIILDKQTNTFKGSTGCNELSGSIWLKGDSIRFFDIETTMIYCENPNAEYRYMGLLDSVSRYKISGNRLALLNGKKRSLVFYKKN